MSVPLEHNYIGLAEVPSAESSDKFSERSNGLKLNLSATELRLGLPGSELPVRDTGVEDKNGYPLGMLKSLAFGAKSGFSDSIDGCSGKLVLCGNGGSEMGVGKDGSLFSPRGVSSGNARAGAGPECNNKPTGLGASVVIDSAPQSPKRLHEKKSQLSAPPAKAQVVGWPPIRSFRKNSMASHPQKNDDDAETKSGCLYVKVSMDGAPYLRKVDLRNFNCYKELSSALEKMFSCFKISEFLSTGQCCSHRVSCKDNLSESRLKDLLHGSEYVLTYEDKDGDWMLVGDVPWQMFTDSCKRLRIMKSSEAIGLAPRAMEKCRNGN